MIKVLKLCPLINKTFIFVRKKKIFIIIILFKKCHKRKYLLHSDVNLYKKKKNLIRKQSSTNLFGNFWFSEFVGMFIPVSIDVLSQQNRRQLSYCKGALCINSKFCKVYTKFCKRNIFIDKT